MVGVERPIVNSLSWAGFGPAKNKSEQREEGVVVGLSTLKVEPLAFALRRPQKTIALNDHSVFA